MGGVNPWAGLYCVRKLAEHGPKEQASKKHSSMVLVCASAPVSRVPLLGSLSDELGAGDMSPPFISNFVDFYSLLLCFG